VNLESGKLSGVKSHDYHIFMERLLPVIFCGYMDDDVWMALDELSHFYRQLCAKEIKKEMMEKLEEEIPVLVCKLEKIFPPGWFNPMQHLLVHLQYEAKQRKQTLRKKKKRNILNVLYISYYVHCFAYYIHAIPYCDLYISLML
jgi:hypothetical protein